MRSTSSHSPTPSPLRWTLLVLALAALAMPSAAQRGKKRFEERTEVLEVQIPVNVVDRSGEPIRGLTADDFELLSDGKRQTISAFQVVDLEVLGPEVTARRANEVIPAAARRHVLLLFDLAFSEPAALVRARRTAREFVLTELHPTDLVAVATHSVDSGSRFLITFTPDRAQLARAIDTMGAPRLIDRPTRDPLSFLVEDPLGGGVDLDTGEGGRVNSFIEQGVQEHLRVMAKQFDKIEKGFSRGRIASWSASMGELAQTLASVQGRKQVVYFSEGFDGRLLLGRQPDAGDTEDQADRLNISLGRSWMVDSDDIYGNTSLQGDVGEMLRLFQRSDCVVHTIDISGLTAGLPDQRRAARVGEDALFYIANETGGRLYKDANEFSGQLAEALDQSSVTYLLTFQPRGIVADGSYHRVKVTAKGVKEARVSHRAGFYAPRAFEELHPLEKNLLAAGAIAAAEPRSEVAVDVLAAPFRASDTEAYVPVVLEVAGETLLAEHGDDVLPVEIYAYATDARGEMRDFFAQMVTMDVSGSTEAFRRRGLKYYGHLDLPVGEHLVRVLVRNAHTGRAGVAAVPVEVPAFGEGEPLLLPPLFPEISPQWHLAREKRDEYQSTIVYPFTVDGDPYIPAARPLLKGGEAAPLLLVGYNLGGGSLEADARILSVGGEVVDAPVELGALYATTTGIAGLDKLKSSFDPAGLAAGDYRLEISLRDPLSGVEYRNSTAFTVPN